MAARPSKFGRRSAAPGRRTWTTPRPWRSASRRARAQAPQLRSDGYLLRAAFGVDAERGGIVLQAGIAQGTKVMLHHRTTEDVLSGTRRMGAELRDRLDGRRPRAVLGFECGARMKPYLGEAAT